MRLYIRKAAALFLAVVLLVSSGCALRDREEKEDFSIVASFYPMYIMLLNITDGIDDVQVHVMAQQHTGCLHDYQLQSSDMQELTKADVFVVNGAGMESFLNRVTEQLPDLPVITATEGMELLHAGETAHDHEEDHDHEEEEVNPHVWVSIKGAMQEVETITQGLMKADPTHAKAYRQNADRYLQQLQELSDEMQAALDPYAGTSIVTFHEAFPYFAEEFGLNIAAVVNREPESEPSARELAETIDLIRNSHVKAVFAEPQYSTDTAQTVAQESGVPVYLLDPCTSGSMEKEAYLTAMRQNMQVLQQALQG